MCILSVYTLLKVVGYYDLSVLSISVMGFQRKSLDWCELYSIFFFGFLDKFKLCIAITHLAVGRPTILISIINFPITSFLLSMWPESHAFQNELRVTWLHGFIQTINYSNLFECRLCLAP